MLAMAGPLADDFDELLGSQHPLLTMSCSDAWRRLGGPVCDNPPVRQDLLDNVVWTEVVRLLEDPGLIQSELYRRLAAAKTADLAKQRQKAVQRELAQARKSMDRLLTAYQEDLLSLE